MIADGGCTDALTQGIIEQYMDAQKEAEVVRVVGVISAVILVLMLIGLSYYFTGGFRQDAPLVDETPAVVLSERGLSDDEKRALYEVAEFARNRDLEAPPYIGEPIPGSPGVYSMARYDEQGRLIDEEDDEQEGVLIQK